VSEDSYVAGQIEHALAADQRTHELGVRAEIDGDAVVLRGEVAGAERRRLVAEVAAEGVPGMIVRNEVSVTEVLPPEETPK
jgi:osmotically-inducible protein OsmY